MSQHGTDAPIPNRVSTSPSPEETPAAPTTVGPSVPASADQPGALDPAVQAILTKCDLIIEQYRLSRVSKSKAASSIYAELKKAVGPDEEAFDTSFSSFMSALDNHDAQEFTAAQHGRRRSASPIDDFGDEDEMAPAPKRAKTVDSSQFPWVIADTIHHVELSSSLAETLRLLILYADDPKAAKRSITNSPSCPEFPNSEWTNLLAGRAVNLDAVFSGYFSTSNNDERIETVGALEIKFGSVTPSKTISNAGEWNTAWIRTIRAVTAAFPHRSEELSHYGDYINSFFSATQTNFHNRIILFDKAVRRRVGSVRSLGLTDFHKFADLKTAHTESIGVAVKCPSEPVTRAHPSRRGRLEACNKWNDGSCTLQGSACRRLHICNLCLKAGHKAPQCPEPTI